MAHANDRTLLASLGFADKDKSLSLHTLACEWAASKSGAGLILQAAKLKDCGSFRSANTEVHISKGEGKYQSTIGFVDVVIHTEESWKGAVGVEVKIGKQDVASIIRQVALYRCYANENTHPLSLRKQWILLVAWDLSEMDASALARESITPLRLGDAFAEFCEQQSGIAKIASL